MQTGSNAQGVAWGGAEGFKIGLAQSLPERAAPLVFVWQVF